MLSYRIRKAIAIAEISDNCVVYKAKEFGVFETKEELLREMIDRLKKGTFLENRIIPLLSAIIEIEETDTIRVRGKEYIHIEIDYEYLGKVNEEIKLILFRYMELQK